MGWSKVPEELALSMAGGVNQREEVACWGISSRETLLMTPEQGTCHVPPSDVGFCQLLGERGSDFSSEILTGQRT